ncbi:MAG TPA: GNAT family N-acetyltransferase [Candidatus Baltobacteraceae bacterium]|jgi:ribosomal protein S18 acetylase RimI-like enzyme
MSLRIRTLERDEIGVCLKLAAAEGWTPGLYDAVPFYAADNDGFFGADLDGEIVGCISAVRYETFGFIGLFIVREDQRRRGYGAALWDHAMHHLQDLPIGLDAVPAQEARYEKEGFARSFLSRRFRYDAREPRAHFESKITLERLRVLDDEIEDYDVQRFGSKRSAFLQSWVAQPDVVALFARSLDSGKIVGYGVGREYGDGTKIGPLFASRIDVAAILFDTIAQRTRSSWLLDIPEPNLTALGLADERGMKPEIACARMWRGTPPTVALASVYGITTWELG